MGRDHTVQCPRCDVYHGGIDDTPCDCEQRERDIRAERDAALAEIEQRKRAAETYLRTLEKQGSEISRLAAECERLRGENQRLRSTPEDK